MTADEYRNRLERPNYSLPVAEFIAQQNAYIEARRIERRMSAERDIARIKTEASFIGASEAVIQTHHYKEDEVSDRFEWYGEFRRAKHEQENIEFYNEKDLV